MSELITFAVSNAEIVATSPLPTMTAGMRNHIVCQFSFGDEWADLDKMAMFRADGGTPYRIPDYEWGNDNTVELPQEVTSVGGKNVEVGVYGFNEDGVAIPTLWIDIGKVKFGVSNEATAPHGTTLTDWERLTYQLRNVMNAIGDLANLDTEIKSNLVAAINEVFERSSGGAVNIQDRLDAWRAEHPSDNIVGFLRTITATGLYTFFDNDYLAIYELTFSTEDGEAGEYYGHLEEYDEGAVDWRHFVYTGETVETLTRNENLEPVNRKFLADQHYLSATATPTSSTAGMQDVYRDTTTGKLVTPAGGGGASFLLVTADFDEATLTVSNLTESFSTIEAAYVTNKIPVFLRAGTYEFELKVFEPQPNSTLDTLTFAANVGTATYYVAVIRRGTILTKKISTLAAMPAAPDSSSVLTSLAIKTYTESAIAAAIGDTAGALSSLDNTLDGLDALIGGDGA